MRPDDAPRIEHKEILLSDYRPPAYLIDRVALIFDLGSSRTRVKARLSIRPNPERAEGGEADLVFDGRNLTLISAAINGAPLSETTYQKDDEGLTIPAEALPDGEFLWECETEIDPSSNTALQGLYVSNGMFCTQCEAQGFRQITYFLDRPDVMSVYEVRIEAEKAAYPVLLSNGEITGRGDLPGGRHFVEWRDPHRKPAYLFALVAGDLAWIEDQFDTASGKPVALRIYVRPGDEGRCAFAMESLKHCMRWDETAYGREYDLSLFMIVAVDDFNMGAMENKGLNIFNSVLVLASPESATDGNYATIEAVVAHEYFHNWTGNRITCRDWFQLCLKEGLTVFRDQQFSADMRSPEVERITNVLRLREAQFTEDSGPLSHPVRPEKYIEINNFYTATVYEKGAEVIRMLHLLAGPAGYRKALNLYFERHDGQACAIEDFAQVFEDACGLNLGQFKRWWSQAGTPEATIAQSYDAAARRLSLTFTQQTPPTPGQPEKAPQHMPVLLGLVGPDGASVPLPGADADGSVQFELREATQTVVFEGVPAGSVLSAFRGLSAPVIVRREATNAERAHLLAHDPDSFNRWEAGREIAQAALLELYANPAAVADADAYVAAMAAAFDVDMDPAFKALLLVAPSAHELAGEIAARGEGADPEAIYQAQAALRGRLAARLAEPMRACYDALADDGPFSPDHASAGRRALRNACLGLLTSRKTSEDYARAERQFTEAGNMTDSIAALAALHTYGAPGAEAALKVFYDRWRSDALTLDKWFAVQAMAPRADALERVKRLERDPAFNWRNPNRFRSLFGAFAGNHRQFHAADGSGYDLLADQIIRLDGSNPQTAARMATAFELWRRYEPNRQAMMRAAVERMLAAKPLSRDLYEISTRIIQAK